AASAPAAEGGTGGAARNAGASSPLTASISGTLDRPDGPSRSPVVGQPYPLGRDTLDKSRSRVPRRASVATIKSLPKGKTLLKPGRHSNTSTEVRPWDWTDLGPPL